MIEDNFIRLNQDFYLDNNDIGKIISVIIDGGYYNKPNKYENCLLVELFSEDGLRPSEITILCNGKLQTVKMYKLSDIQIKYLS